MQDPGFCWRCSQVSLLGNLGPSRICIPWAVAHFPRSNRKMPGSVAHNLDPGAAING